MPTQLWANRDTTANTVNTLTQPYEKKLLQALNVTGPEQKIKQDRQIKYASKINALTLCTYQSFIPLEVSDVIFLPTI
jgi:hypothetical protein